MIKSLSVRVKIFFILFVTLAVAWFFSCQLSRPDAKDCMSQAGEDDGFGSVIGKLQIELSADDLLDVERAFRCREMVGLPVSPLVKRMKQIDPDSSMGYLARHKIAGLKKPVRVYRWDLTVEGYDRSVFTDPQIVLRVYASRNRGAKILDSSVFCSTQIRSCPKPK